ncbi:hypothetical protein L3073_06025 [Ancylomarina sp. DW003]|nr:hypothetical protein [Ancylomarina sp. DW003]MDE5421758.1 hypothetical protein [Ancylomarina sp. DW003]
MLGVLPAAMVAKKGVEKYRNLKPNQKKAVNLTGLAVGALVLLMGYKLYSGMGETFDVLTGKKKEEERKHNEIVYKKEVAKELVNNGQRPTLTQIEAKDTAQALFVAMDGMGTDEAQIIAALQIPKNKADWLLIGAAFGLPDGLNLVGWLYKELNAKELRVIRATLSKINVKI